MTHTEQPALVLTTADPRFCPTSALTVNGYRFVPGHLPPSSISLTHVPQNQTDERSHEYTNFTIAGVDGLVIDWLGGVCPVQAEGKLDGEDFYFRSRGIRWEVWIGPAEHHFTQHPSVWSHREELPGAKKFEAGWMVEATALAKITQAVTLWRARAKA